MTLACVKLANNNNSRSSTLQILRKVWWWNNGGSTPFLGFIPSLWGLVGENLFFLETKTHSVICVGLELTWLASNSWHFSCLNSQVQKLQTLATIPSFWGGGGGGGDGVVAVEVLEEEVVVMVLSIKPRTSSMLGRNSTIDRHLSPTQSPFWENQMQPQNWTRLTLFVKLQC